MKRLTYLDEKKSIILYGSVFLLILIIFYYNRFVAGIAFLISGYVMYLDFKNKEAMSERFVKDLEAINESFDEITRGAVFAIPFPLVITDSKGLIVWYNSRFKELVSITGDVFRKPLNAVIEEIDFERVKKEDQLEVEYKDDHLLFYINKFEKTTGDDEITYLLYGIDNTPYINLKEQCEDEELAVMLLTIDNYDDVRQQAPEESRSFIFAEVDNMIKEYAKKYEAYARRYESDKYMILIERKHLEEMKEDNFSLLDETREAEIGNTLPITLSAGVSFTGENLLDIQREGNNALEIALGRGGDQVVLKTGDELEYFGGKNQAQVKRNRVKARVISEAAQNLMKESGNILIMGHQNPDMDSMGAALGMLEMAKHLEKEAYIILNEVTPAIFRLYKKLEEEESIISRIINSEEAEELYSPSSLIVVVDNHRKNSTECPELLEHTDRVILIDHHRRGQDYIKNTILTYLEPYASSASEMVTDLLDYLPGRIDMPEIVADALLAGIIVDTKGFNYQTGVRTFEVASILKRLGADSVNVKHLFKDDKETMILRSRVVVNMEVYDENIAIGILEEEVEGGILVSAQAADELLNIIDMDASFVLTPVDGKIHISGRSSGVISVQLILEKLGGGGHLTAAGTQMETSLEEAIVLLKEAIDEYKEEDEDEIYID